jgi:RNA polymerase primary sigma factor
VTEESDRWVEAYVREAGLAPRLSRDEAVLLTRRVHDGDAEAKESLVAGSRRLVVMTVRKYVRAAPDQDDWEARTTVQSLDSEQLAELLPKGEDGLLTAIERFDESKGFSFPTYASWWIRQAIIEGTQGGDPDGVREPRSPGPAAPSRAAAVAPEVRSCEPDRSPATAFPT